MAQTQKVEGQVEIRSHADKFFEAWAHKPHCISKLCPSKITNIVQHEGNTWHGVGSKHTWDYAMGNERASVTSVVEKIDENNRAVSYNIVDGLIMKNYYKTMKSKIEVSPKGEKSIVKWSFEYEKMNEDAPEPDMYIDFLLSSVKDMDANL